MSKLAVPLNVDSMLTDAVRSRRVRGLTGHELDASRSMFGGTPSFALAVPIEVRGTVIAVIYADDSDHTQAEGASDRRVKFTEVLLWHAVPLMARLAAKKKSSRSTANTPSACCATSNLFTRRKPARATPSAS